VQRLGLRLQLRKLQAEAGDIVLLYGDESEALTHPYLARAWAKPGADLRVPAPGQAKKVAMLGSLDHATRRLIVHTSGTKRSSDFIAHLEQLDRLHGPQPGRQAKPVVLVEDNGPIHTSKRSLAALAARAHCLTVEWLPKYAPELNDIERDQEGRVGWLWSKLRIVAAIPCEHPLAEQDALDWERLRKETFLVQGWDSSQSARAFYASFMGCGVKFQRHAASKQSVFALIAAGFGITLATASQAEVVFPGVVYRPIREDNA
jgi:DDE superfamily endonuclease/LysR substrate binding domain-containing protein